MVRCPKPAKRPQGSKVKKPSMKPSAKSRQTYPKNAHMDPDKTTARETTLRNLRNAIGANAPKYMAMLILDDRHLTLASRLVAEYPDADVMVVERDKATFEQQERIAESLERVHVFHQDLFEVEDLEPFEVIVADLMGNLAQTDFAKFCSGALGAWMRSPRSVFLSVSRSTRGSLCGKGARRKRQGGVKPQKQDKIFAKNLSADIYDPETGQMVVGEMNLFQVHSWQQKGSSIMHSFEFDKRGGGVAPVFDKYTNEDPSDTSEHWVGYGK